MDTNLKGKVKWFDITRGYGFIHLLDSDADYFVHKRDVIDKDIIEGQIVTFDEKDGRKGIVACNVRKIKYI